MSDGFADLGMRFVTEGAERADRALDRVAVGAGKAEAATEGLARASMEASSASAQMAASIDRAVTQAEAVDRAARGATGGMDGLAGSQARAAIAASRYGAANDHAAMTAARATTQTKALQNATLNLTRQFSDLGVTAAMGMNPLMILIQQGPQIADAFQMAKSQGLGFSAVMRGLGSQLVGFAKVGGPIALAVAGVAALAYAMVKGSVEAAHFENMLTATGNAAGLTAQSYEDMAARIGDATDSSVRSAKAGISQLAATGQFSAKTIETLVVAAERYSKLTGQSTSDILKDYASMTDGVTKWAAKHAVVYHDLSLAQLKRIDELEKAGQAEEAYQMAASGIRDTVEQRMLPAYGLLERIMHGVAKAASNMWDQILGIGRQKTIEDQIAAAQTRVTGLQNSMKNPTAFGDQATKNGLADGSLLKAAQLKLSVLEGFKAGTDRKAAEDAAKASKESDAIRKAFLSPKSSTAHGPRDASESAIDAAVRDELTARMALTKDVETIAALKRAQVDAELESQKDRLTEQRVGKSITAAAEATALAKYRQAAEEKKQLIDIEEAGAIAQRDLEQRKSVASSLDRIGAAQSAFAKTAEEAGRIEMEALARRQDLERDEFADRTAQQLALGEITVLMAAERASHLLAAQQAEKALAEHQAQVKVINATTDIAEEELRTRAAGLDAQASLTRSAYARAAIDSKLLEIQQQIARLEAERAVKIAVAGSDEERIAKLRLQALGLTQAAEKELAKRDQRLVNAVQEAADAARGFRDAFKRHDWVGLLDDLQRTIETIQAAFQSQGLLGGTLTAGSALASLIGGKAGNAIGTGLGIGALGLTTGTALVNAGSLGLLGSLSGGAIGLGAVLGPIALAAGALYAAAKIFNVGGKPTNAGAGVDLVTGAITGDKRTSETEQAAKSAADAIKGFQDAVKAAGIGLTTTVNGLVLGSRDQTQIYLSSGQTLFSAVGDAAAAVDASAKAILRDATYASEQQKKVVDGLVAAGKSVDDIVAALGAYEAAQNIAGSISDAILQLTDPKAFDLKGVDTAIQAQRDAVKAAADAGYLTADQLSGINAQLDTLRGLQIDEVMKRYVVAVDEATDAAQVLADAQAATDQGRSDLVDAYNAEASVHREAIDRYKQIVSGLKAFGQELRIGGVGATNPFDQYIAAKREFDRLSALPAGSTERLANIETVGRAFIEASKAVSPSELDLNRDIAAVRRAVETSQTAAQSQVDSETQQLVELTSVVSQLVDLNKGVMTVVQAIAALTVVMAAERAAGGNPTLPANDNLPGSIQQYIADNKDLARNFNSGGSLTGLGSTLEEAARAHYLMTGQYEIAAGLRKFAGGGDHPGGLRLVGERGPELEATGPARIYNADQTRKMLAGGQDYAAMVAEMRALRAEVAALRADAKDTAKATRALDDRGRRLEVIGQYVRGSAPDEPVSTQAA